MIINSILEKVKLRLSLKNGEISIDCRELMLKEKHRTI